MALNINPTAFVNSITSSIESFGQNLQSTGVDAVSNFKKSDLANTIDNLAGAIGTGFNGVTGQIEADGPPGSGLGPNDVRTLGNSTISTDLGSIFGVISEGSTDFAEAVGTAGNIVNAVDTITGGDIAQGLQDVAGQVNKTAGQIDDILSIKRGANIPNAAELFSPTQTSQATIVDRTPVNDWRVRIGCNFDVFGTTSGDLFARLKDTNGIVFPYQPRVTFSTRANYNEIEPIHSNYPILGYKNSQVDSIQISGEFSVENSDDGEYWLAATTFFRTATKMFFGQGANVGNPPIICKLDGYGTNLFNSIPVVITSFQVSLDDDVNYVRTVHKGKTTWVPILSTIQVECKPIYNRSNLRKFNLSEFAKGTMTTGTGTTGRGYI